MACDNWTISLNNIVFTPYFDVRRVESFERYTSDMSNEFISKFKDHFMYFVDQWVRRNCTTYVSEIKISSYYSMEQTTLPFNLYFTLKFSCSILLDNEVFSIFGKTLSSLQKDDFFGTCVLQSRLEIKSGINPFPSATSNSIKLLTEAFLDEKIILKYDENKYEQYADNTMDSLTSSSSARDDGSFSMGVLHTDHDNVNRDESNRSVEDGKNITLLNIIIERGGVYGNDCRAFWRNKSLIAAEFELYKNMVIRQISIDINNPKKLFEYACLFMFEELCGFISNSFNISNVHSLWSSSPPSFDVIKTKVITRKRMRIHQQKQTQNNKKHCGYPNVSQMNSSTHSTNSTNNTSTTHHAGSFVHGDVFGESLNSSISSSSSFDSSTMRSKLSTHSSINDSIEMVGSGNINRYQHVYSSRKTDLSPSIARNLKSMESNGVDEKSDQYAQIMSLKVSTDVMQPFHDFVSSVIQKKRYADKHSFLDLFRHVSASSIKNFCTPLIHDLILYFISKYNAEDSSFHISKKVFNVVIRNAITSHVSNSSYYDFSFLDRMKKFGRMESMQHACFTMQFFASHCYGIFTLLSTNVESSQFILFNLITMNTLFFNEGIKLSAVSSFAHKTSDEKFSMMVGKPPIVPHYNQSFFANLYELMVFSRYCKDILHDIIDMERKRQPSVEPFSLINILDNCSECHATINNLMCVKNTPKVYLIYWIDTLASIFTGMFLYLMGNFSSEIVSYFDSLRHYYIMTALSQSHSASSSPSFMLDNIALFDGDHSQRVTETQWKEFVDTLGGVNFASSKSGTIYSVCLGLLLVIQSQFEWIAINYCSKIKI